ncbi:hypothetical protein JAAARDRAFT_40760 [Jaapia argillacea MUCL 33604]|uniref:Uncharacterized protein n=1 Tax=Jaapia argillacea MUCL 33604 TaxID=933084 RepID=A0A067PL26_9AGAM|nr:hypothetical protein JAAARDRAFT_40760 [Jaapia argillacea MUCL 33604]
MYATPAALQIVEICREICIHLKDPHDQKKSQSSLLSLAQCSRAFSQPALDLLWETLYDMEPLLKLLSGLVVESRLVDDRGVKFYTIARTLRDRDWTRYDNYSRRVRVLDYTHTGKVDSDIYLQLT